MQMSTRPSCPPAILSALLVMALLLSGCAKPAPGPGGTPALTTGPPPATDDCPDHWHAVLHLVVANETLALGEDPRHLDQMSDPIGFHMHDADGVLHFHPPKGACIPLEEALEKVGITVTNGGFILEGQEGRSGSYPPTDTFRPEMYAQGWGQDWVQVDLEGPEFFQAQVPDGTRMLLTYRDPAVDDLEARLAAVPPIPASYRP